MHPYVELTAKWYFDLKLTGPLNIPPYSSLKVGFLSLRSPLCSAWHADNFKGRLRAWCTLLSAYLEVHGLSFYRRYTIAACMP